MENENVLLKALADGVFDMDEDAVAEAAEKYIENGFDPLKGISEGLALGMNKAGKCYEEGEYYIPELLLCSDAMYRGIDILRPHIKKDSSSEHKMVAVVGVVEGDTHDIGKNLFKIMLETVGFEVQDLGRDVPTDLFVEKAKEHKANLVGMSTLMTTTMKNMEVIINKLKTADIRNDLVVMVGGGPISMDFAKKIGADGYEPDASSAAKTARKLVEAKLRVA